MPPAPRSSAPHPPDSAARPDRRAAIVRAAYRLIAERGLEGLRFADVARAAGINNGTLLYYFASKDVLIRAVGAFMAEQFARTAAPQNPAAPLEPLEAIRWEFVDAGEHLQDQAAIVYTELLARAQRDASVAALLRDIDAAWSGWLASLLERGRQAGVIRADVDVELVALTIMTAIRGVGMQAMIAGDPASVAPVVRALADLVLGWISARPPTPTPTPPPSAPSRTARGSSRRCRTVRAPRQ